MKNEGKFTSTSKHVLSLQCQAHKTSHLNILNTFRVMIILRLLLLLTNLHLKLLSTQGTGADKILSTQRVNGQRTIGQQVKKWEFS